MAPSTAGRCAVDGESDPEPGKGQASPQEQARRVAVRVLTFVFPGGRNQRRDLCGYIVSRTTPRSSLAKRVEIDLVAQTGGEALEGSLSIVARR